MFKILYILLFIFNQSDCSQLQTVRDHYHQINSEEQLEVFITNVEKMNCESITPYLASAIMQKAQYTYLPYKKLSYFSKGKKQLESFIEKKPGNIEARYVRLLVQHQSPGFLGYNKNMKEDKNFIKLNIHKSSLPLNYQKKILHILDSIQINR